MAIRSPCIHEGLPILTNIQMDCELTSGKCFRCQLSILHLYTFLCLFPVVFVLFYSFVFLFLLLLLFLVLVVVVVVVVLLLLLLLLIIIIIVIISLISNIPCWNYILFKDGRVYIDLKTSSISWNSVQ